MFTAYKDKYRLSTKKLFALIIVVLFGFGVFSSNAQETRKEKKKAKKLFKRDKKDARKLSKVNPDYIDLLATDKILLGMHTGGIDDRFVLRDNKNENYYHLASSIVPSVGLHFKYKRLPTISFSLPLNIFNKNSNFITKGYRFGLHFQPSRLIVLDAYFFQIKGLKLREVGVEKIEKDSTYHSSNTLNLTMEMFFLFNNAKYSYKNAFLSGEIQKKSSGSFVMGLSYSFFNQINDEHLFNPNFTLNKSINYKNNWGFSLASMFGYLHTFVINKNWYIGGGFLYGPNFHFGKAEYFGHQKDAIYANVSSSFKVKFATGYNSKHFLIKLIAHTGFYGYKPSKENAFNNYLTDFRLSGTYIFLNYK